MSNKSYNSKSMRSKDFKGINSTFYKDSKFSLNFPPLQKRRNSDLLRHKVEIERECNKKVERIVPLLTNIKNYDKIDESICLLRDLCWTGIPGDLRGDVWMALFKTLQPTEEKDLYFDLLKKIEQNKGEIEKQLHPAFFKQVKLDVPRTWVLNKEAVLTKHIPKEALQRILTNILNVFILHNPHIGYIQGINEIASFILTTLGNCEDFTEPDSKSRIKELEVNTYWCFYNLLEDIGCLFNLGNEPNKTPEFIEKLKFIVKTIDPLFYTHLLDKGIDFLHFAFRWISCLYIREIPKEYVQRFWDVFLCESVNSFFDGFVDFALYLSAAILFNFKGDLEIKDFQDSVLFLQKLPIETWDSETINILLSKAYLYKAIYEGYVK